MKPSELTTDQLLFNTAYYLIQTGFAETAEILLLCELEEYQEYEREIYGGWNNEELLDVENWGRVIILTPPTIHQLLTQKNDAKNHKQQMEFAFASILRWNGATLIPNVQLVTAVEENWREYLKSLAKGEKRSNQGLPIKKNDIAVVWHNLNFRSPIEKKVAEALDRAGVMYFANCMARLGPTDYRHNKEPDFLICSNGKWGILEVDGQAFHQSAAQDAERDRQFRRHGIIVIEHFEAKKCNELPDAVVEEFLNILQQSD
jgi:hypothetical protein